MTQEKTIVQGWGGRGELLREREREKERRGRKEKKKSFFFGNTRI